MQHKTVKPDGGEQSDREEYYEAVEAAVDAIEVSIDLADGDVDLPYEVWETLDSSQYIMYYSKNMIVLKESDNEPGEWKHLVNDNDSWRDVIQALAYSTMEQDLWDEIRDRGLDE